MNEDDPPNEADRILALTFAYTALVRCLVQTRALDHDHLLLNLGQAQARLDELGYVGAAEALRGLNESLLGIG